MKSSASFEKEIAMSSDAPKSSPPPPSENSGGNGGSNPSPSSGTDAVKENTKQSVHEILENTKGR